MEMLSTFRLTSSQLVSLLQILGALIADYRSNPNGKMNKALTPLVKSPLRWKELPGLDTAVKTALAGGDKLSVLYELGTELKEAFPTFHKNREYSAPELDMLKAMRAYLMTDSESALRYITKNASVFGSPELSEAFMPDVPKSDNNTLRKLVKSLVGRDDVSLSMSEAELIKETDPTAYTQYQELRKSHNTSFKAMLMNYVRASKKKAVPYVEAYQYFQERGFTKSLVPGFTGFIDDQGKWYTREGELINGVPNLVTYSHVVMNDGKDPNAEWVFKAIKHEGGAAYAYTANFKRSQSKAKYARVRDLMKTIPQIRKKWLAKVNAFDMDDKLSVAAVVLEILYSFAARIGSAPGRGAGTLVAKQARINQGGISLIYLGKDSIPTKHVLKETDPIHKKIIDALTEMLDEKSGNEFIFTYTIKGKHKRCTPSDVNAAFRTFGAPAELTVHKLRTLRATSLAVNLIAKDAETRRPPKDEKEALARYMQMMTAVGKLLNHKRGVGGSNEKVTGATAIGSYVDADVQLALWETWGFRPPTFLEKLVRSEEE